MNDNIKSILLTIVIVILVSGLFFFMLKGISELAYAEDSYQLPISQPQVIDWFSTEGEMILNRDNGIFKRGETAILVDVETGKFWSVYRYGGKWHADVTPTTKEDTAIMKEAVGKWSWDRRGGIILLDGTWYACSYFCMPHGGSPLSANDFGGHFCIHFSNSKIHNSGKIDLKHQKIIKEVTYLELNEIVTRAIFSHIILT